MPHSHDHNCCSHEANPSEDPLEVGIQYSLFSKIDLDNMETLGEAEDGTGKKVFKPYEERLNLADYVESDCDPELLFNIPFTGNIKLKAIRIIGLDDDSHPKKVRIYKNRPKMSFDDIGAKPEQEFELTRDPNGVMEYNTQVVKFSSVHHLSLHFPRNFGGEITRINYIGLKGEFTQVFRHGVTICNYETTPNVSDHKTDITNTSNFYIE